MKKIMISGGTLVLAAFTLGACDKKFFESEPVIVPTNYGNVTCQLYTKDNVWWDESISHPQTMTEESADDVCVQIGERLANQ